MTDGDVGLARVGERQRLGQPGVVADLGVERDLLATGQPALLAVLDQEAEREAGARLAAGAAVDGLIGIALLVPLADDMPLADHQEGVGAVDLRTVLPRQGELVPVHAGRLGDFLFDHVVWLALFGDERAPPTLVLRWWEVVGDL